jgi:hypothetical protein
LLHIIAFSSLLRIRIVVFALLIVASSLPIIAIVITVVADANIIFWHDLTVQHC